MQTTNKLQAPKIPQSHIDFAKAVSDLADTAGIKNFKLTYQSDRRPELRSVKGDIIITYSAKDGRGRPSRNLNIGMDCKLEMQIISSPSSY